MYRYNNWGGDGSWGMMSAGWGGHEWVLWVVAFAVPFIIVAILWSVVWKGLALWHSGRRGEYWWFMILLVVNTLGVLEIIYLFFVAGLKLKDLFSTRSHGHHGN